jgi:carotenoid 1,2-hydratase
MDGLVPSARIADADAGSLSGGRERASGAGRANGGNFRSLGGRSSDGGFCFDTQVPAGGYIWWYVDAISPDGRHGLTIIAFIGSVFSPYYAFARRHNGGDPRNHCAINVALYNESNKRWSMTERPRQRLHQTGNSLTIGPSTLVWHGDVLTIQIDERTAPIPSALRGTVCVYPKALADQTFALDAGARHRWRPIAPCAHVEVLMSQPSLRWHGSGYVDSNSGDEGIEDAFQSWHWSRADLRCGTAVLYDVVPRGGSAASLARLFNPAGEIKQFDSPALVDLPPTRWNIRRQTRAEDAGSVGVVRTLESAPFYARSLISTRLVGEQAFAVHESLSLDRFRSPWVQTLLPFRMPRMPR